MTSFARCAGVAAMLLLALPGCSAQHLYQGSHGWRRSFCDRNVGPERARCEAVADRSYTDYRRDTEAGKAPR
jgi:hypothetical protein